MESSVNGKKLEGGEIKETAIVKPAIHNQMSTISDELTTVERPSWATIISIGVC